MKQEEIDKILQVYNELDSSKYKIYNEVSNLKLKIARRENKIAKLRERQNKELEALKVLSDFKEGEKVILKKGKNEGTLFSPKFVDVFVFVREVRVTITNGRIRFLYRLNKCTKSGQMSKVSFKGKRYSFEVYELSKIK